MHIVRLVGLGLVLGVTTAPAQITSTRTIGRLTAAARDSARHVIEISAVYADAPMVRITGYRGTVAVLTVTASPRSVRSWLDAGSQSYTGSRSYLYSRENTNQLWVSGNPKGATSEVSVFVGPQGCSCVGQVPPVGGPYTRAQVTQLYVYLRRAAALADSMESWAPMTSPLVSKPPAPRRHFFDFQVEKQARVATDDRPECPDITRTGQGDGAVTGQFVVDAFGRVDTTTFRVITSSHEALTQALRAFLPRMKWSPAELDGEPVPQLAWYTVAFTKGIGGC